MLMRIRNVNGRRASRFSRAGLQRLRKTRSGYWAVFTAENSIVDPDFHGFHG